jgi:hypothetical protein
VSYASAVPGALSALVNALTLALPGVEVTDGPPVRNSQAMEALAVGWSPSEDIDAVEVTTATSDLAGRADRETVLVHCSLGVLSGERDLAAARARAYELHAAVGDVFTDDPQLRGAVMSVGMGDHALRQSDTDTGMLARINFTVRIDAFTRP